MAVATEKDAGVPNSVLEVPPAGLEPATVGLEVSFRPSIWSYGVGNVLQTGQSRRPRSFWSGSVRLVRGIGRGILSLTQARMKAPVEVRGRSNWAMEAGV